MTSKPVSQDFDDMISELFYKYIPYQTCSIVEKFSDIKPAVVEVLQFPDWHNSWCDSAITEYQFWALVNYWRLESTYPATSEQVFIHLTAVVIKEYGYSHRVKNVLSVAYAALVGQEDYERRNKMRPMDARRFIRHSLYCIGNNFNGQNSPFSGSVDLGLHREY